MRYKINYTQHLCSKSWLLDNADWVQQFIGLIKIKPVQHNCIIYPSQRFTEQTQERFFLPISHVCSTQTDSDPTFFVMMNQELQIKNKQTHVRTHACQDPQSEIKIKHIQHLFSKSWQKDNSNWLSHFKSRRNKKKWITSAKYILHNSPKNKHKNCFCYLLLNLFNTKQSMTPLYLVWFLKTDQEQASTPAISRLLKSTKWDQQ